MEQRRGRLESRWTVVDGLPVHARVSVEPRPAGSPAIVLVHGLGVASRYMVPTAERLALAYHVYAPDLPGFGQSGKPRHALSVPELADALARWMEATQLERAVLLGNSFGCQVVVDFAVRHPERIQRAVLAGPTGDPHGRSALRQFARWLLNMPASRARLGQCLSVTTCS